MEEIREKLSQIEDTRHASYVEHKGDSNKKC